MSETQSPFNALPPVVVALAVVITGIEILFQLATAGMLGGAEGVGWRIGAYQQYAVLDPVWEQMRALGVWPWEHLLRFVTYPLLHGGLYHAAFVVVILLAMGKMVGEVFSPLAFLALFWVSSIVGGLAYVMLLDPRAPLIGGYPGVYGLIGAFSFLQWAIATRGGAEQFMAFRLIAILLAIQLAFSAFTGDYGNLVADASGFVAGFLASFVLVPGGWQRLLARLRQR